jgi:predicted nucleic acid-binding protein
VRGYLLDNNHIWAWFRGEESVTNKIRSIPVDWYIGICNITLGEIEAGHQINEPIDLEAEQLRKRFDKWLNETFIADSLAVKDTTRFSYGRLVATMLRLYPRVGDIKLERHLVLKGVDLNDVWAVSIAWEHNLTFVTTDKMTIIKEAAAEIEKDAGEKIRFDCWIPT